jgi:outer membrane protein assembly factor BamB
VAPIIPTGLAGTANSELGIEPTTTPVPFPAYSQAPDGSYPCPMLRGLSIGESTVGVASDSGLSVFDQTTGTLLHKNFRSTFDAPQPPQLLGDVVVQQIEPTSTDNTQKGLAQLIATNARSEKLMWATEIPVQNTNRPVIFRASGHHENTMLHIVSPQAIIALNSAGKAIWRTPPGEEQSDKPPDYFGSIGVTDTSVVATSRKSFSGFDRLTGRKQWKRSITGAHTAFVQPTNSHRVVAITINAFKTSGD